LIVQFILHGNPPLDQHADVNRFAYMTNLLNEKSPQRMRIIRD
jgi:hypothetical protein